MSSTTTKVLGSFGRLWGRCHESFAPANRRVLRVTGASATSYLQGLVTSDLMSDPTPPRPEPEDADKPGVPKRYQKTVEGDEPVAVEFNTQLRATTFLDNKGRIVTDSLLWKINGSDNDSYFIDCPGSTADALLAHLKSFRLRKTKVTIADVSDQVSSHVVFGTLAAGAAPPGFVAGMDPRHPSLGMRVLGGVDGVDPTTDFSSLMSDTFPASPENYELVRRLAGVAEGTELTGRIALESNQEFLNAVSFTKGCYLGQELTARVNFTGAVRKRIMPLLLMDQSTQVPHAWALASSLQEGHAKERFTPKELKRLPGRLPRLSVLTAGNMVAIMTGSVEPEGEAVDEDAAHELVKVKERADKLLESIERSCTNNAKIYDDKDGKTIGQIVSAPVKGTNVALALMKLDAVGLMSKGVWSKTNKIRIGEDSDDEFRYLPYLPLWWPELDPETGKQKVHRLNEDYDEDKEESNDELEEPKVPPRTATIEFEQVSLNEQDGAAKTRPQ